MRKANAAERAELERIAARLQGIGDEIREVPSQTPLTVKRWLGAMELLRVTRLRQDVTSYIPVQGKMRTPRERLDILAAELRFVETAHRFGA